MTYYKLDQETSNLIDDLVTMATSFADMQLDDATRDMLFDQIAEVYNRFNLPKHELTDLELVEDNQNASKLNNEESGTVLPFKPQLRIIDPAIKD